MLTTGDVLLVALSVVLVIVSAVLLGIEVALGRVSVAKAERLEREGKPGSARLVVITRDPARYLNLLLLLRLAAELGATSIVAVLLATHAIHGYAAIAAAAGLMTLVSYIFIGVAPRTLAVQHSESIALKTAAFALFVTRLFGPLPRLLILLGNALTPGRGFPSGPFATETELRDLVDLAERRQVIEEGERDMIHSVFELGDTLVREVMVPRTDIVFVERTKTVRQALTLALRSGFSRIPVAGENVDDIVGVVYLKDLARRAAGGDGKAEQRVEDVMRPATFVPESKPVDELLREMQAAQTHMSVVVDEYGGTAGLVTIEDILEEIVGEITDEYDQEAPTVETVDERTVRVTSRLPVDEVKEMYHVELDVDDVDTVGGLLAACLGRVPIPGASVTLDGLTFI
ncbi:MAG: magnesium and cobalt exporter, family, partial [Gaiellaceae bacterium]|nr:magnesium and cobalt exporter, family [Gaiellaceae bacterium]